MYESKASSWTAPSTVTPPPCTSRAPLVIVATSSASRLFENQIGQRVLAGGEADTFDGTLFDRGWTDAPHRTLRNSTVEAWERVGRPGDETRRLEPRYALLMAARTLLQRIHNPSNYECGCAPDCWCRRTAIGRLVKWWFPARWFGIHHKNSFFDGMTWDEIRAWKQAQEAKGLYP